MCSELNDLYDANRQANRTVEKLIEAANDRDTMLISQYQRLAISASLTMR